MNEWIQWRQRQLQFIIFGARSRIQVRVRLKLVHLFERWFDAERPTAIPIPSPNYALLAEAKPAVKVIDVVACECAFVSNSNEALGL
jgi:hypothetical protein